MTITKIQKLRKGRKLALPVMLSGVRAGFPSPAEDFIDKKLDLNSHLIRNPDSTYLMYANGDSMTERGILDGAILVVDRSIAPIDGKVVIAIIEGLMTVKLFRKKGRRVWLESDSNEPARYPVIEITDPDAIVWGVSLWAINPL